MEVFGPFLSFFLDLVARTFVSWGIISAGSKDLFVQYLNTIVVGILMLVPSIIGLAKIVDVRNAKLPAGKSVAQPTAGNFTPPASQETNPGAVPAPSTNNLPNPPVS